MQPFCQERYINCRFFLFQPAAARQETTYWNPLLIHSLLVEELDFILFALIFSDLNQPCRSSVSVSASFTVECSDDGFFSVSHPSNSWFSFPPPHRSGWHKCRKEGKSLPVHSLSEFHSSEPPVCELYLHLLYWGGTGTQGFFLFEKGPEDAGEISRALTEAFLIRVWQHGKEEQPEGYVSALFTLVRKNAAFSDEYLLQTYCFHMCLTTLRLHCQHTDVRIQFLVNAGIKLMFNLNNNNKKKKNTPHLLMAKESRFGFRWADQAT